MKTRLTFACLLFSIALVSQDYQPLESSGKIPKDFTEMSSKKYSRDLKKISRNDKSRKKRDQKEYYLQSNFILDDFLHSGMVLFNDPISNYLQRVGDVLLENEPKLKGKVRFYATRSSVANAFATNSGIVFVNVGLMAQLENEAQLAFILAHEITHIKEKHNLNLFLEGKDLDRSKNKNNLKIFSQGKVSKKITDRNQYSRELESEADKMGLELFLKSNYSIEEITKSFEVLHYALYPFQEIEFNKSFFETAHLKFPDSYHLKEINIIDGITDEDEDGTHPSIYSRAAESSKAINGKSNEGRQTFLVSESDFKQVQSLARHELLNYNLRDFNYHRAIYNAFLLKKMPAYNDDLYYTKTIGKALYGLSKIKNYKLDEAEDTDEDEEDFGELFKKGESHRLIHFFEQLNSKELNVLCVRYLYDATQLYPTDDMLKKLLADAGDELLLHHYKDWKEFAEKAPETTVVDSTKIADAPTGQLSKYDKIKSKQQNSSGDYLAYAFADVYNDPAFKELTQRKKPRKKKQERIEDAPDGIALGERKVLIIRPFQKHLNSSNSEVDHLRSEKLENNLSELTEEMLEKVGLKAVILDPEQFRASDTEKFNELRMVSEWMSYSLALDSAQVIAHNQEQIDAIMEKYGVDTFVWTGVISQRNADIYRAYLHLFFHQPFFVYRLFNPRGQSMFISMILDGRTGQPRAFKYNYNTHSYKKAVLKSQLYDLFYQINRRK